MEQKQKTEEYLPKGPADIFSKSFKSIADEAKKLMLREVKKKIQQRYNNADNIIKQRTAISRDD